MDKSGPTGQVDSWTMPLTVTPKGAMYSVPFVLGLDAYSYKVGKHMASRVETRVKMSVRETSSTSAAKRPASATPARLVQAGVNGSTTFLWNSDGAHSSDSGASQVRKKRQKRTDDLLHELVMTCGDPIDVVSHWFEIFAFYCDPPEAIALPRLPERREAKDIFIDKIDMPAVQSLSCPTSRQSTKRPARRGRTRSFSAPRLRKTEMVRVQSPSLDNEKKLDLMRSDLYKTRSVLKEAGLAGKGAGHLDLGHRLKAQSLNAESFASWMESFSFILNLQRPKADMAVPLGPKGKSNQGHQGHGGHGGHGGRGGRGGHGQRSHSPPRRRSVAPRRASDVENVTKRLLARLDQRVVLGSWELITGEEAKEASSSATSSDEELERRQKIAQSFLAPMSPQFYVTCPQSPRLCELPMACTLRREPCGDPSVIQKLDAIHESPQAFCVVSPQNVSKPSPDSECGGTVISTTSFRLPAQSQHVHEDLLAASHVA